MPNSRLRPHPAAAFTLLVLFWAADSEANWSANGAVVCNQSSNQNFPAIVADGVGGAVIIWTDNRFSNGDIFAQRLTGDGEALWSGNGVAVCADPGAQFSPVAITDRAFGAVVTWYDNRTGARGLYAQRMNAAGIPLWAENGVPLVLGSIFQVGLISDGSNGTVVPYGFIAGWVKAGVGDDTAIGAQHFNNEGARLWGAAGITLVSSTANKYDLAIASDGGAPLTFTRGAVLVWAEGSGTSVDIKAKRVGHDGGQQWAVGGVGVCTATGQQGNAQVAAVGSNQTIIVWEDQRTPDADLYAQKLDGNGAAQWLANGLPVCRAPGPQVIPQILTDNAGGALIAWLDQGEDRIYGQRLNSSGQPLWGTDGVPLTTTGSAQSDLKIISDNAGGMIAVWRDQRNGNYDIYAQRVDANGNALWASEGVAVTTNPEWQEYPAIVTDAANGMFAAWVDYQAGGQNTDIYANRVMAGGGIVDVEAGGPAAFELAIASPNPARRGAHLRLGLLEAAGVHVDVLDIAGRRVRRLAAGRFEAGHHVVAWDGTDETGARVGPGVYFVRAQAGAQSATARIAVLQ